MSGECAGEMRGQCVRIGDVRPFPGLLPDKAQAVKVLEEASEVHGAWQSWDLFGNLGEQFRAEHRVTDRLLDEIADCIQACCNLSHALGVDDLAPYMERCEARNRERGRY